MADRRLEGPRGDRRNRHKNLDANKNVTADNVIAVDFGARADTPSFTEEVRLAA